MTHAFDTKRGRHLFFRRKTILVGLNFAYLFNSILSSHPVMQNCDKDLLSIILAVQWLLVKMLLTLEPHGIF